METRFHLDENVNGAVANGLRLRGIDVTTTKDAGLVGATDEAQLAFAHNHNRVFFTHDDDLLSLGSDGREHAGIAFCHPRHRTIGEVILGLTHLWRTQTAESMKHCVEFL